MYETYRETYENYSTHRLMSLAETFRASLSAVYADDNSYGQIRRPQAQQKSTRTLVCAGDGVIAHLDYSYRANAKDILNDMHDIDSVIDEGLFRVREARAKYAAPMAELFMHLEWEAERFLERRLGSGLRTVDDCLKIPATIAREFRP